MSIFSSTYLGSSRGDPKDNYIVKNGRFAFWPIAIATSLYNISSNIYGLMRHPLSINSAPYVTRRSGQLCGQITNLPSIQDWNGCLRDTNKYDINSWDSCVEKNIHAPPHLYLSGSWLTSSQKKRLFLNQSASVEINSINCVQWLGYIPAPPQINLTAIPSRTFIHPYAAKCFNCSNDIENNSIHMCEPANVERLCGPLFSDFIEYLNDQTKISTQSSTDNTPLVSDDYYTYNDDGISDSTTLSTASPKLTKQSFQVTLIKQENLQILGDFGDPAFSPNDPM